MDNSLHTTRVNSYDHRKSKTKVKAAYFYTKIIHLQQLLQNTRSSALKVNDTALLIMVLLQGLCYVVDITMVLALLSITFLGTGGFLVIRYKLFKMAVC